MATTRQHADSDVPELVGATCNALLAVPGEAQNRIAVLYLLADSTWHRLFLDEGVLFLDQSDGPDREDDLADGESYLDLLDRCGCRGSRIDAVRIKNGILTITFSPSGTLTLREAPGGTLLLGSLV